MLDLIAHFGTLMNDVTIWMHLQKETVVCPQCGSTVRVARDFCLRCLLAVGFDPGDDPNKTFDGLLSDIDFQDAEYPILESSGLEQFEPVNCRE